MKSKIIYATTLLSFAFILFSSCKKSSTTTNNLASLYGTWQTTHFGGANDTLKMVISSGTTVGIITYMGSSTSIATTFSVNDTLFSGITFTATNIYSSLGTYRYSNGGGPLVGHANNVMTLESPTTLFVHYSADPNTGITPPDYYYTKL